LPTGIHVALNAIQELLSMKTSTYEAYWEFEYKTEATAETIHQASTVGLITQVLVLVFAILFTYFYVRKVHPPHAHVISLKTNRHGNIAFTKKTR
jgi:hypothetical protein